MRCVIYKIAPWQLTGANAFPIFLKVFLIHFPWKRTYLVRLREEQFAKGFINYLTVINVKRHLLLGERDRSNTILIAQTKFVLPAALTTPPIHLPAASKNPLQLRSAWAHLSFLQLSHLSVIFLLQFSFSLMTAFLASESLLCASSKAPLTALAAASRA